ncbi:MAG TPA: hypothetical protein VNZ45_01710 [Bacteroidia bacterium]|jgi:hypothetical protein|nr:hypothetical protein [Bacteroidia bacterium]
MRTKKLVKVELTYWTYLPLPGNGSGSPDNSLPVVPDGDDDIDPGYGVEEGGLPGQGLPSRPSKEEILEKLAEYEDEIREKVQEVKDAIADRIPGIKEQLDAIVAEIKAKIQELKDYLATLAPGQGLPVYPGQPLPGRPGRPGQLPGGIDLEAIKAKVDAIKQAVGERIAGAKELLEALKDAIANFPVFGNCQERMEAIRAAVDAKIESLKADLANKGADVVAKIEAAKEALADRINTIKEGVDPGYGVDVGGSPEQGLPGEPERAPKRVRRFRR